MPLQGKQSSEFFCVFLELQIIGGVEYEQYGDLLCIVYCWVPQHHPNYI